MDGVADRLRTQRAIHEEVGDPALRDTETEPAAIFEPTLVANGRRNGAVPCDRCNDTRVVRKGLYEATIDVALQARRQQMRPLAADLDKVGAVCAAAYGGVKRIERQARIGVAAHALP